MWGLFVLLVAGAVNAMPNDVKLTPVPEYVQAREAFTHARLYLQQNLPFELKDIHDPEARKHFAFGILAAVTGQIAKSHSMHITYDPLIILDLTVPEVWEDYNVVSHYFNKLLSDAQIKIQPITSLIDTVCTTTNSVADCNNQVHQKIMDSNTMLKNRAKVLLALGKVSKTLGDHEYELLQMARSFQVVPYLIKTMQTHTYRNFIRDLSDLNNMIVNNVYN